MVQIYRVGDQSSNSIIWLRHDLEPQLIDLANKKWSNLVNYTDIKLKIGVAVAERYKLTMFKTVSCSVMCIPSNFIKSLIYFYFEALIHVLLSLLLFMFPAADGSCLKRQLLETICQSIKQLAAKQAEE